MSAQTWQKGHGIVTEEKYGFLVEKKLADSHSAKRPYKLMKILNFHVILYLNPTKLSTNSYSLRDCKPSS